MKPAAPATKTHYPVLDGLRGVAALLVVIYHLFQPFDQGDPAKQIVNHGYLAVDFFFLLSGFVVAYAYDDRWGRMSLSGFFTRRLIRLQPMVVMGTLVGLATLHFQTGPVFPHIATAPAWRVALLTVLGAALIPIPVGPLNIRGTRETYPLNGPSWSLMYEYIANFLYAVLLRKLSVRVLAAITACAGLVTLRLAIRDGDMIGGWGLNREHLVVGFVRLAFPFLAGMLLMRSGKRIHLRGAFACSSALLALCLCSPRLTGHEWRNGVYDAFCILVMFPLIVAIGAGEGRHAGIAGQDRLAAWLGGISYPLYITHYPLVYVWSAWVGGPAHPSGHSAMLWLTGLALFLGAILLASLLLRFYDEPVRRWLNRRFLGKASA